MHRTFKSAGLALCLLSAVTIVPAGPAGAQLREDEQAPPKPASEREQEARILLEQAIRLEDRGELTAARLLYRDIIERFDGTVAAAQALERLSNIESRPDWGPGPPPLPEGRRAPETPARGRDPKPAVSGIDQSGRVSVIVQSTVLTTWLGLAIPIAADAGNSTPYGVGLLLGAPVGLFTSLYATRDRQVNATQADVFGQASRMGLWHGLALGVIYDWDGRDVALASALGGIAGAGVGTSMILSGRNRESSAAYAGLASTYGIWLGLVGAQVFRSEDTSSEDDEIITAMLAGGDLALAAAIISRKNITLSRSRSRLISVSGAVGALAGGAADLIFQIDDRQDAWTLVGVGTIGGLIAGTALTADYDRNRAFEDRAEFFSLKPTVRRDLSGRPMTGVLLFDARF